MRIAINACSEKERQGYYLQSLLKAIVTDHPQHSFLVICNEKCMFSGLQENVSFELCSFPSGFIKQRWWLDVKLPSIIKQWKADVLVNFHGRCSLGIKIPQVMEVSNLLFMHEEGYSSAKRFMKKRLLSKQFKKARSIFTYSQFVKKEINGFDVDEQKIVVINKSAGETFKPLEWKEKQEIKDGYADGREYFLFAGGLEPVKNLMNVLKAFSQFKKWQHSNMKLLITGDTTINTQMRQKIETYKFRDDVVVLNYVTDEQMSKLMAAAYALIYPSLYEGFGLPILEAMQSGTPMITADNSAMPETGGEAVLYVDANDESQIAAQMMKLYKDEDLREKLIESGKVHAANYRLASSANQLWNVIQSAVN